jgi:hypothetical protein
MTEASAADLAVVIVNYETGACSSAVSVRSNVLEVMCRLTWS